MVRLRAEPSTRASTAHTQDSLCCLTDTIHLFTKAARVAVAVLSVTTPIIMRCGDRRTPTKDRCMSLFAGLGLLTVYVPIRVEAHLRQSIPHQTIMDATTIMGTTTLPAGSMPSTDLSAHHSQDPSSTDHAQRMVRRRKSSGALRDQFAADGRRSRAPSVSGTTVPVSQAPPVPPLPSNATM
ncbi:hypothetical protein PENSPDRAFT_193955 [Peniophora sp. CONT]|nr:hypothetical protein PENSPDRAFT_193955 [Peniophora sp. CONT]